MDLSHWLIIIPARLKSERLPRKPLSTLAGKPLIVRVFENLAPLAKHGAQIVVAVDHEDTAVICSQYNVPHVMTREDHQSGTDRCHEVAQRFTKHPLILNVQGDEPFIDTNDLTALMAKMENSNFPMGTLGIRNQDWTQFQDPNIVKIVLGHDETAIYFSRASVPFDRETHRAGINKADFTQHMGIYAFRRDGLERFCQLPPSTLEQTEKLEQLRAISAGWKIHVSVAKHPSLGIDTPQDLAEANRRFHG